VRAVNVLMSALRAIEDSCAKLRMRLSPYRVKSHNPFRDCCDEHELDPHAPDCHHQPTETRP
jgi:hypothetical protein